MMRQASVLAVTLVAVVLDLGGRGAHAVFEDYYDLADYDYGFTAQEPDCLVDAESGVSTLNGTACDLEIKGDDQAIKLPGGVTGIYKYVNCQNGRPSYKRETVEGEVAPMYLAYSLYWGDWDLCNESVLTDESVLGYGGEGFGEMRPEDVLPEDWYILKDLVEDQSSPDDFVSVPKIIVNCITVVRNTSVPGNCSDGIMNGEEEGVDCGGSCRSCIQYADQKEAIQALKDKLRMEWEEKQRESQMTGVAKASIIIIALIGAAIVCGGPLIYLARSLRGRSNGAQYAQLPVLNRPKPAAN